MDFAIYSSQFMNMSTNKQTNKTKTERKKEKEKEKRKKRRQTLNICLTIFRARYAVERIPHHNTDSVFWV